jgi:hypothetical protein
MVPGLVATGRSRPMRSPPVRWSSVVWGPTVVSMPAVTAVSSVTSMSTVSMSSEFCVDNAGRFMERTTSLADDCPDDTFETVTLLELFARHFRVTNSERFLPFIDLRYKVLNLCLHPINVTHFRVKIVVVQFGAFSFSYSLCGWEQLICGQPAFIRITDDQWALRLVEHDRKAQSVKNFAVNGLNCESQKLSVGFRKIVEAVEGP